MFKIAVSFSSTSNKSSLRESKSRCPSARLAWQQQQQQQMRLRNREQQLVVDDDLPERQHGRNAPIANATATRPRTKKETMIAIATIASVVRCSIFIPLLFWSRLKNVCLSPLPLRFWANQPFLGNLVVVVVWRLLERLQPIMEGAAIHS